MSRRAHQERTGPQTGPQTAPEPSAASGAARADRTLVRLAAGDLQMQQGPQSRGVLVLSRLVAMRVTACRLPSLV